MGKALTTRVVNTSLGRAESFSPRKSLDRPLQEPKFPQKTRFSPISSSSRPAPVKFLAQHLLPMACACPRKNKAHFFPYSRLMTSSRRFRLSSKIIPRWRRSHSPKILSRLFHQFTQLPWQPATRSCHRDISSVTQERARGQPKGSPGHPEHSPRSTSKAPWRPNQP